MEELKNNKIFWAVIIFTVFNVFCFGAFKLVVSKTTDAVIKKLQSDYSPSPYGPGIDPDKVSPEAFKARKVFQVKSTTAPVSTTDWRDDFEKERSSNP